MLVPKIGAVPPSARWIVPSTGLSNSATLLVG
jgi:hypothetical protein